MLWLNSLPGRFKREIINKLINDKIELSLANNYNIYVDFGHGGGSEKDGGSEPENSPIRVTIHQLDKKQARVTDQSCEKEGKVNDYDNDLM